VITVHLPPSYGGLAGLASTQLATGIRDIEPSPDSVSRQHWHDFECDSEDGSLSVNDKSGVMTALFPKGSWVWVEEVPDEVVGTAFPDSELVTK